jgi:hypothetical protein
VASDRPGADPQPDLLGNDAGGKRLDPGQPQFHGPRASEWTVMVLAAVTLPSRPSP